MKQYQRSVTLIILVFFTMIFVLTFNVGEASIMGSKEKKDQIVTAESVEKLIELIESALKSNDTKRLAQIKALNIQMVEDNKRLTIRECGTLLDKSIKAELAGEQTKSNSYFMVCQILAEIYHDVTKSNYLLSKVSILRDLRRDNKKKYLLADELYKKGNESLRKYKHDASMDLYKKSLSLYREIHFKEGEANCLKHLGDVYNNLDDYAKAKQHYGQALEIYKDIKARLGEADCLQNLGIVHRILADYEKAREYHKQALVIYRELKARLGEANCLHSLGDVNRFLVDYKNSQQYYEQALVICREIKVKLVEANCLESLGRVLIIQAEYEKACQMYKHSLNIYQQIKEPMGQANCLLALGMVHRILFEYEKARQRLEQALEIYRDIKVRIGEANCLQVLGGLHRLLSEHEKSAQRFEQALVINREINHPLGEANCLFSLGEGHRILSENEKALKRFEQALDIFQKIKTPFSEANCLQSLGNLYWMLGDYEKARKKHQQALLIYRRLKYRLGEANSLRGLGNVDNSLAKYENAQQRNKQALLIYREIKGQLGEANSLQNLGDVHINLKDYNNALQYYKQSLKIQRKIGDVHGTMWSYYQLGKIFEAINKYTEAEKSYNASIKIMEKVWGQMKTDELKTSYFASSIKPFKAIIHLLFKQKKGKSAFQYAERSKARTFLYLIGNQRIDPKRGVSRKLVNEEENLKQVITSMTLTIMEHEKNQKSNHSSLKELREKLQKSKQRHNEIIETIKLQSPEYASLKTVNPLPIEEIQALIRQDSNTVLIEYYITEKETYLWLLDGKQLYPYKINISQKGLKSSIEHFGKLLTDSASKLTTLARISRKLYNLLLKPAEKHILGKSRIAVVPHGSLHYLPFETLMNKGKFLVEQGFNFFYLPSASVYKYCRDKNSLKKEYLMAIGNPDGTLPLSENEVKEISHLYQKNAKIFINKDATESAIKKNVSHPDLLHFACHGRFDAKHPMYSALILAPDTSDDGRLEVSEIFNLKLKPAYLVTLSACDTNMGKMYHGDEIVGLSRAFIYAGTPSIVTSLWDVDDYYTKEFMSTFYRALKTTDKIDALNIARKTIIQKHRKRHPFYWAAFVLIGDPR